MPTEYSAEWVKVPDGNGGQRKVWMRDSKARRDLDAVKTNISTLQTDVDALNTKTAYTTGNATINTAFLDASSTAQYIKFGRLVIVYCVLSWNNGIPNSNEYFLSGLPVPAKATGAFFPVQLSSSNGRIGNNIGNGSLWIKTDGRVYNWYGAKPVLNTDSKFQFMYIAAE